MTTCQLPTDIIDILADIIVDRRGSEPQSYMQTTAMLGYIKPNQAYAADQRGFTPSDKDSAHPQPLHDADNIPSRLSFQGQWRQNFARQPVEGNILGGNDSLVVENNFLEIPVAETTPENLGYYRASLFKNGDPFVFECCKNLPVSEMHIGESYVAGYIMDPLAGGGVYLEHHNTPHFHMPKNADAGGYLVLGKRRDDDYQVSAFKIPFGYGIYTAPHILHNDCFLTGKYNVVYNVAENYATAILKTKQDEIVNVAIKAGTIKSGAIKASAINARQA
ncbi:hypothetical protein [Candidatus Spongiihabitans sp.]|uniref:hypothetical protein n=1 Tax=Candidatus Spongiihabitans sp. TaxID=3101308 RepID=UPI003C7ABF78